MQCNSSIISSALPPLLELLDEFASTINHYRVQSAKLYPLLYKIILVDLVLNHTSFSVVEIEAKDLEAEMYIERLEALLIKWKTEKDRLPLNILIDLALASGGTEDFVQEWAPKQIADMNSEYDFVTHAVRNMKHTLAAGRLSWAEVKRQLFEKNGEESMETSGQATIWIASRVVGGL
jgi:hypothetical protein